MLTYAVFESNVPMQFTIWVVPTLMFAYLAVFLS